MAGCRERDTRANAADTTRGAHIKVLRVVRRPPAHSRHRFCAVCVDSPPAPRPQVPPDVDSPSFKASMGTVTYVPDMDAIKWTIRQFHGGKEALMRAHFGLPSVSSGSFVCSGPLGVRVSVPTALYARTHDHDEPRSALSMNYFTVSHVRSRCLPADEVDADKWRKRSIQVRFEMPYFTVSGIQVRYLKILEKSGYAALPWVRYITQNGDYQLRMA